MRAMLGVVWHYWVGVVMAVGAVATVVALIAGYLKQVESGRYPRER
jgi:hypothetical protein